MALYVGTNYHPHDWTPERWKKDIALMKEAGFQAVASQINRGNRRHGYLHFSKPERSACSFRLRPIKTRRLSRFSSGFHGRW